MKLALSLTSGFIAIFPSFWWILLYSPGVIAGTAGTISLVALNPSSTMRIVTGVFAGVAPVCSVAACIAFLTYIGNRRMGDGKAFVLEALCFLCALPCVLMPGALFSDWVLGIVANNLVGYPYGGSDAVKAL